MSMDKCREAFEQIPDIAIYLKAGVYWDDEHEQYDAHNYTNTQYLTFVDAAWWMYQSRQAEVDEQHKINVALNSENIKQREQITHYMNQCVEKRRRIRELQAKNNAVEHELGCAMIAPKEVFQFAERIGKALRGEDE